MLRLLFIFTMGMITFATNAYAIPAFARQMGISCNACHSQNGFPALNRFGRSFKASGYTMVGAQKSISDDQNGQFLSITDTLNLSLNVKLGYVKNSDPATSSEIQFPKDLGFMIAGRVANNIGIFTEIGYESEDSNSPVFQLSTLVVPVVYEIQNYTLGTVFYRTSEFGASASYDTLATGSKANGQTLEAVSATSAQSYIIDNAGEEDPAEGIGFYAASDLWYAVYSAYVPTVGTVSGITPASYASLAYTPQVGNWDIGMSGQLWWGTAKRNDTNTSLPKLEDKTDKFALNFQALGAVNELPLSCFITYGEAKQGTIYATTPNKVKAGTIMGEVAPIPHVLMFSASYRVADNGQNTNSQDNAELLAVKYFYKENVQCQFNYVFNENSEKRNEVYLTLRAVF